MAESLLLLGPEASGTDHHLRLQLLSMNAAASVALARQQCKQQVRVFFLLDRSVSRWTENNVTTGLHTVHRN